MKKAVIVLVLLLVCNLMGCGVTETAQMAREESGEAVTESVSEARNAASADAAIRNEEEASTQAVSSELEEQLTILAKNRKQWLSHFYLEDGETGYDSINYTVADLNQNGRLEVVAYICEGSGAFTNYYVSEVTEDDTVEEWEFKGEPHRDIGAEMMTMYYDEGEDTYAYICGDSSGGFGGHGYEPGYILIDQTTIKEKGYDCAKIFWNDTEKWQYEGKDGEEITEKEYDKIIAEATPKGKKGHAYFHWGWGSVEELSALSEQELKEELTELSQGFFIRFGQKNEKSYKKQIRYLAAKKKEWLKLLPRTILHRDGETIEPGYQIMIMDLNQNGCIELGVRCDTDKTTVLEVNEDGEGFTQWSATGGMPDFSSVRAYRSSEDDAVHFVSDSEYEYGKWHLLDSVLADGKQMKTTQISAAIGDDDELEEWRDIYNDDDELEEWQDTYNDDDDEMVVDMNYYDGNNKKITKQEYDSIEQAFYKALTPIKFYIKDMISPTGYRFDFEELEQLTDEELTDMLEDGMECFVLE